MVQVWVRRICNVKGARVDGGSPAEHEVVKAADALATLNKQVRYSLIIFEYGEQVA